MQSRHHLYQYLLIFRFILLNIIATGIAVAIYLQGWLDGALHGETFWLSLVIILVFAIGLVVCGQKVWRTSIELNQIRKEQPAPQSRADKYLVSIINHSAESRSTSANLLRLRMTNYISLVQHLANTLVFLGLVGTVIGFIVALAGVDPQSSINVETVAPMITTLVQGMSIALYTTLIGSVLHIWLMINHRILATGTMHLFNTIVELGEQRAEP